MPVHTLRLLTTSTVISLAVLGIAMIQTALASPMLRPTAQSNTYVEVCPWLDCKPGAVSYSQDDYENIDPTGENSCQMALENAGFRGTFYYDGLISPSMLITLSTAGHEIGAHLVNHRANCTIPPACYPNCTPEGLWQTPYTDAQVENFRQNQIDPNVATIESYTGQPVLSMAYPCGSTDAVRMTAALSYFIGVRGYYDPWDSNLPWVYDVNTSTPAEFMNLNSDTYFDPALVDRAIAEGAWQIVTVHDYCEGINYLNDQRDNLWIAPVGEVLKYIRVRDAAHITHYARTGSTISFDAAHNLPVFHRQQLNGTFLLPITYDNPVTLRARIDSEAEILSVQANGTNLPYTVETISEVRYVRFNTPLTPSQHIVIQGDGPLAIKVAHFSAAPSGTNMAFAVVAAGFGITGLLILWKRR